MKEPDTWRAGDSEITLTQWIVAIIIVLLAIYGFISLLHDIGNFLNPFENVIAYIHESTKPNTNK